MYKKRQKLLRYHQTSVAKIFEKENQLIAQLQANELEQCLLLWQANEPTLVLPAGNKWPESEPLRAALTTQNAHANWQLLSRKTGGAPVPQCPGVINLSHLYVWPENQAYSVKLAYENLCSVLTLFFAKFGLDSQTHATEFSYCDGDYNINLHGKKIVGTAQRVIIKKGGGKIVLAQAFILIDVLLAELIKPVNLCYEFCGVSDRVKAEVHTALFENINERPSIEVLFQSITQAFIDSGLYS
tara:strand:- start:141 stop:866 length:726 start_codon:yes stop_codon:yes gene_type:complete